METSRKKPRIDEDKQDYVFFGTSIIGSDGIEEGKYEPVWRQEVRDERGRRRLHGAFTGGFVAGYFNTVGSKEGWTPQSFRSSRKERAILKVSKAEDYMDAEDLAEREEERHLRTNDDFIGIGCEDINQEKKGSILDDLIIKKESVGIRLLKKMGWKEGQGVGPLVKRSALDDETEDEYASKYLFAPKDSIIDFFKNKTDLYGLGYVPAPAIERLQHLTDNNTPKFGISGTSFGYGVLNEDDNEYDHEVYDFESSKIKYDTVLDHEEKKKSVSNTKLKPVTKHLFVPRKKNTVGIEVKRCQDGSLPLNGFIVSEVYCIEKKAWFDPPVVPSDYVPCAPHSERKIISGNLLQPRDRGAILGETPLPGKSVFDFLSPSARERMVQATGRTDLPPARNEGAMMRENPEPFIPLIDKKMALDALNNKFLPYEDNQDKKKRYILFLQEHAGIVQRGSYESVAPHDYKKEADEFAKSARIFKPMTGIMKNRFTSSSSFSSVSIVDNSSKGGIIDIPAKESNTAEEAAKMNMFGSLTRIITTFYPARLLCKRFNVRNPHPDKQSDISNVNDDSKNELVNLSVVENIMREVKGDETYILPEKRQEILNIDDTTNKALEKERPDMDIFISIFGDDKDDDN
ncbi:hypothetical protein T552_02801 [Pneumocystis carinii B80]|uniref:G-patch domain-containing protein n=1 Tax=Pneumocystis carinii (strain B80) TaxID=1408658 RepID=A0A0W4ZD27_PNEC8|nr:hypothetical protein T552_02801 [Pneumocystis carinii B80]KTW26315.1 hypothetical protein T552_02801 [Pneumocystis carinii B80]